MPWTFGAFVICGLSLIGIPGTAGFVSKWYLIAAVLDEGVLGLVALAVIIAGSLMAVVYVWRFVETAMFGDDDMECTRSEAPLPLVATLWVIATLNIFFGIRPEIPVELSRRAAELLLVHVS
jgi:multicomponent Na+:H+ antiporter subunit D